MQKTRDKSKKRAAILDGAIDVFIRSGYEQAGMDTIAETAGVSKRTVYNHFGSKENLFQAVVADFLAQRNELKPVRYDPQKTLEEQLLAFAEAEIFLVSSPRRVGLSRMLAQVFLQDIRYAENTVVQFPPKYDLMLEWLRAADKDGRIHAEDLVMAARMFYALIEGGVTWPAVFREGMDESDMKTVLRESIALFLTRYGCEK